MMRTLATLLLRFLIIALATVTSACDSGYTLKPTTWLEQTPSRYEHNFGDFTLRIRSVVGLIGETRLQPAIEVTANSETVTLISASLQTANGRYAGVVDSSIAAAPPGGDRLSVYWTFGAAHPTVEVVGSRAEITLEMSVGPRAKTVLTVLEYAA